MRTRWTTTALCAAIAALLLAPAGPARAQAPGSAGLLGIGVDVSVQGGPVASVADVGTPVGIQGLQGFRVELDPGWAVGGGLELPVSGNFAARGDLMVSPGAELSTGSITCPVGGGTTEPEHCGARSGGSFWAATGGVVYRTEPDPGTPGGFVHVGAGVKRYDFSREPTILGLEGDSLAAGPCAAGDAVCETHLDFAGGHTDVTGRIGAGLSVRAAGLRLSGEISDFVSIFTPAGDRERTVQHEIYFTVRVARRL